MDIVMDMLAQEMSLALCLKEALMNPTAKSRYTGSGPLLQDQSNSQVYSETDSIKEGHLFYSVPIQCYFTLALY